MKIIRNITLALAALTLQATAWANEIHGLKYTTTGDVRPNEWTIQYDKVIEKATTEGIPVVVVWARESCGLCKKLITAIQTDAVQNWHANRGYLCLIGVEGQADAQRTIKLAMKGTSLPFVGVYWDKDGDGKPDVQVKWCGRGMEMPVKQGDLGQQYMASVDKYLGEYSPMRNSSFEAPDTEDDRLECEDGTATVDVVLVREESLAKDALTEKLVVSGPKAASKTITLNWAAGETAKTNTIDVTKFTFAADGEQITLELRDSENAQVAVNHITYVKRENSAANPKWLGEEFEYGEWTCDLEAAKTMVKGETGDAYTLVGIQGSKWCPDCANTERNFLDLTDVSTGENRFRAWAKKNKIALVSMDIPNYTGPTVADCQTPTLFSKAAYATKLARASEYPASGAPAELTNAVVRSGLGYLTRKGVSDSDAAAVMNRFHTLTYTNTDKGGFHRPEDGNKNRTGVPIFVLLRKDGSVAARFTRFAAVSPMAADRDSFEQHLYRFEEMLELAKEDPNEIENNDPTTTQDALKAGVARNASLCLADMTDAYRLDGVTGNAVLQVKVTSAEGCAYPGATIEVSGWQVVDGKGSQLAGAKMTGKLADGITLGYTLPQPLSGKNDGYCVRVASSFDEGFSAASKTKRNFAKYDLGVEVVRYVPSEARAYGVADENGKAKTTLVAGGIYRFDGLDIEKCSTWLIPVFKDDPLCKYFVAKDDCAAAELPVLGGKGAAFNFQRWVAGGIGFEPVSRTVPVYINDEKGDWIEITVKRLDGGSGWIKANVEVDTAKTSLTNYLGEARYVFKPAELEWADGDTSDRTVKVQVIDDVAYDGDGDVVLAIRNLTSEAGDAKVVADKAEYRLTVTEDDKATPGKVSFIGVEPYWAKKLTVYTRENEAVKIWTKRVGTGSDGLLGTEVKSSVAGTTFATENPRDLTPVTNSAKKVQQVLWWSHRETAGKYLAVGGIPAGRSARISLNSYKKSQTVSGSNSVTVVSVAADAPGFKDISNSATLYLYTESNQHVAMDPNFCQGGKLTFTKLSGTLPSGITVKYDEQAGDMLLTGVPTKAGKYEAYYQVSERRGSKTVPGMVARITFTVIDPAANGTGAGGIGALNRSCVTSRTLSDIMFVDDETKALGAVVTLTIPSNGRLSAKFTGLLGSGSFSSKSWSKVDPASGELMAVLTGTGTFKDATMRVSAAPDGTVSIGIGGLSSLYTASHSGKVWSRTNSAESYQGYYTVVIPTLKPDGTGTPWHENGIIESAEGFAPRGDGYLTLKLQNSSAWNAGKVTWAGQLPNGTAISGTAVLSEVGATPDKAFLPILKKSSKDFCSAVAAISRNAYQRACEQEDPETCFRAITAAELEFGGIQGTVYPFWSHNENNTATAVGNYTVRSEMFGSIYDSTLGFDQCCEWFTGSTDMLLGALKPTASQSYGSFGDIQSVTVRLDQQKNTMTILKGTEYPNPNGLTLSYTRSTGVVSGSFKLPYTDAKTGKEKTLSASYRGVVLLGWSSSCGCGDYQLPFMSGAFNFSDKLNYQDARGTVRTMTVKRGQVIELVTKEGSKE